jgi:hypothetical protein
METAKVVLSTPWPCVYHDLVGDQLVLAMRPTTLRTQAKNTAREAKQYDLLALPPTRQQCRVWYAGSDVRRHGSILAAMLANTGCSLATADFSLPVPTAWHLRMEARLRGWQPLLPILVYRPLVERTEWAGCKGRNPDFDAYFRIFNAVRKYFFVVSVADLVPDREWVVGRPVVGDLEFHRGELVCEEMAALFQRATLVFSSPGFAPLLAQAVGTPSVCIFGGHESSMTIQHGARHAPTLGIDPIEPCDCFDHKHQHRKAIDITRAIARVESFVHMHLTRRRYACSPAPPVETQSHRAVDSAGKDRTHAGRLDEPFEKIHQRGGVGAADHAHRNHPTEDGC